MDDLKTTVHLKNLVQSAAKLKLNAEYWDVRIEDSFETSITLVDGEVVTCTSSPSLGAFLRIRRDGFWYYQSTTEISQIPTLLEQLCQSAAAALVKTQFSDKQKYFIAQTYQPFIALKAREKKFSAVPIAQKLETAEKYDRVMAKTKEVASRTIRYKDIYKIKAYLNSVGTQFEYDFNQGGIACGFTLREEQHLFEDAMRLYGCEFSSLQNQEAELSAFLVESKRFLRAPAIQPGKYKVVMNPEVTGVFTHESFGHKSESDFMLGNAEAMEEWKIGKKIGADCLTIADDGLRYGTSGYCPIDDDGTPAQKNYLIKNGVLSGRLHSRETAFQLDEKPTGNSRALNFEFEPIVRMTSTYVEPGNESVESILRRSEGAILVESYRHGSGLSTFTIAPLRGYRIGPNGSLDPVRLTVISGSVFETLKNVEAVSSDFQLKNSAIGGCGKMEQFPLPVSMGGPFMVVSEMQVS